MKKNFVNYCSLFINEYSVDLQRNRGYLSEKARIKAIESIDTVLTKGVVTPANLLGCIQQPEEPEEVIGILWLLITGPSAWISDFYIYPDWRGRGFGGLALCEMKRLLKIMDINEVGLRVAPNNASAKALYQKNGFHITGINMSQNLK
ncbi:GNAT family N-acetyltransferase [Pantoea agglomerans]|uniref:GNAT family N-acetyltransferase n=1 Tax=Enterobacter agglomerans TaxID=549 RepID=UPI001F004D6C|nr:GNAT family N-acetyltransferase [Pantoea agglomerans]WVL82191.1 GNAT family N-acetyltransferase [Pantoea agglomerans]